MVVGCIEVSAATAEEPLRFETGCRLRCRVEVRFGFRAKG